MENEKYIKGFNDVYLLKQYKPQLIENLLNISSSSDYIQGLKDGGLTYYQKKIKSRTQDLNKIKYLKNKGQEKGLER
ncbi:hypothetical protein H9I45_11910 [Polaribacter haliotis]|uniref:Uncharacterized protein n=1 Tax=Polaribacter haliotis TaxID=1888915 RepID=A0A7L8ADP8_9FLAO|nr:hypothetical protein [Polaribacter haliotis]QOD60044.1 hypothetical protein H9I45_11910 [Polaribacter haliotis]